MSPTISPSRVRLIVQGVFTLFCLYIGYEFYHYFLWATGQTEVFTAKPPSAEGFLPIAALMSAKQLYLTGEWDMIHPAGLTIFLAAITMALLFRKGFCGWICPIGFISNLLNRIGKKLKLQRTVSGKLELILLIPKYLILGGFVYFIVISMSIWSIKSFAKSPYNFVADSKMLMFFLQPSGTALTVIAALIVFALFVRSAWCRFLCPYGALLGIVAMASPVGIQRDTSSCIECGKCRKSCPAEIAVDTKARVNSPECIGCGECTGSCPVEGCLSMKAANTKTPYWLAGAGAVCTLIMFYYWALATGHWTSDIPMDVIRRFHLLFFKM